MAAHRVVQCNHSQKVPGEGRPHWVLLSASTGADLKMGNKKERGRGKEAVNTVSIDGLSHSSLPYSSGIIDFGFVGAFTTVTTLA